MPTSKFEDKLQQMQEQLTALTKKIKEFSDQISSVKWETNVMKEKNKSLRNALGEVTIGRMIVPALKTQLQLSIRSRSFLESTATTADEQKMEDVAAVDKLLKFMDIADRKLTKYSKIGCTTLNVRFPGHFFSKRIANWQWN